MACSHCKQEAGTPGFLLAVAASHVLCLYGHSRDPVRRQALAAAAVMQITNHFVEAGAGQVLWCLTPYKTSRRTLTVAGPVLCVTLTLQLAWLGWLQTGE